MVFIYILDYESCKIKQLCIKKDDIDNISKILQQYGLDDTKCNYMISEKMLFVEMLI